jgi:hypothetical protein
MKYDKDMYYEMVKCLGYASEPLNKWISSITADDLDNILYSCDWNMSDVMTDIANDDTVPADVREFCRLNQDNVSVFIIECTSKLFEINSPIFDSDYGNVWQNADTEILQYAACLTSDHSMYRDLLDDALENYKRFCKFDYCITTDKNCMAVREVSYIKLIDDYDDVIEDNSNLISYVNDLEDYEYEITLDNYITFDSIFDAIHKLENLTDPYDDAYLTDDLMEMKIVIKYETPLTLTHHESAPELLKILKSYYY